MKKIFARLCLTLLFIAPCKAIFSDLGFDDFAKPAVAIVGGAGVIVGSLAYYFGSRSADAERIKQERLSKQEKEEREEQEKCQEAEKFITKMEKRYKNEYNVVNSDKKLTYEELADCAAEGFNHKTPYIHLSYARQLKEDLNQFAEHYYGLPDDKRWFADGLEEALKKVSNTHSILFKTILSSELEREKITLAEERKREINENIERERLRQEILKRECFEALKKGNEGFVKQANEALIAVKKQGLEEMKTMANYAATMHTNNLAAHSLILQDLRAEFKNNGLTSLANKINGLEKQVAQLNKNVAEGSRESKKITETFGVHRDQLNQIKNEINTLRNENRLSKEQIDRMNKIIERAENTLAIISADIGDIKSGNTTGAMTAPLKESHW